MSTLVRILLRYIAGALILKGLLPADLGNELANDPEVISALELVIGAGIAAVVEGWYWLAKRMGWKT